MCSKIAKGVVFEDANDNDSDSEENSRGNSTSIDCNKDCVGTELEKKAEKNEEDVAKSIWDVSTCSETAEKFRDQDQEPDLEKDTQDNEPKVQSPKWQVCPETFYNKPKWIEAISRGEFTSCLQPCSVWEVLSVQVYSSQGNLKKTQLLLTFGITCQVAVKLRVRPMKQ